MFNWNDIRLFLAVAQAGSTLGAARALGLNQTTVSRRMQTLEHDLQLTLFERRTRGYRLTEDGRALLRRAEAMSTDAEALGLHAQELGRRVSGTLRISAPEVVFARLVAPILAEFHTTRPEVQIEYDSSEALLDLVDGEADIAFRACERVLDERLVGQKLCDIDWAVYCSRAYAAEHGMPAGPQDIRHHDVVAYGSTVAHRPGNIWFMSLVDGARITGHSNTVMNMTSVLKAGIGVGILTCMQGDIEPDLIRCFAPIDQIRSSLWLLTVPQKRHLPRVAAFIDTVVGSAAVRRIVAGVTGKPV